MTGTTCTCGRPTSGAWLCDKSDKGAGCQGTLAIAIANINAYYADLETIATKRARYSTQGTTKGSIGKAQPIIVDGRFLDRTAAGSQLRWDAWNTIHAWCRTIKEDQPEVTGPTCATECLHLSCASIHRRRWPKDTFAAMCMYLDRQFRWAVREQWAPVMLDELINLERRLARLVDRPADKWYAGKCWVTGDQGTDCTTELYATTDRGWIDCPGCGIRHDVAERRTVLLKEAKDYLVTATEAAAALLAWTDYGGTEDNLIRRISKWHERGRLTGKGDTTVNGRTRRLYRLGDIQDRMIEEIQRAQVALLTS